jgi:VanZ family protein
MKQFLQQILRVMPYIFWAMLVTVTALMLIELAPKEEGWPYWDKVQHAVVFVILAVTGCLAFTKKRLWVCISLIAFGGIIEVLQGTFTTTRQASINDWLADILGILIAIGTMALIRKLSKQNNTLTL